MGQILRWAELDRYVLFGRDRFFVQESGPVAPLANGASGGWKHGARAADELYNRHPAKAPDGGADFY